MASKTELEELGKNFIDLEIDILNKTNTSIFENGIYNEAYIKIPEWEQGIQEFLMPNEQERNVGKKKIKIYYQGIAELVNKAYIRYKEILSNIDRLNLKLYLQISDILEQEQKILNLKTYESNKKIIEAQEHLNNLVLCSSSRHLKELENIFNSKELQKAIETVLKSKDNKEVQKEFSARQIKEFERLNNLIQEKRSTEIEEEIQELRNTIAEAKDRQEGYNQQRKENEKHKVKDGITLEELEKDRNTITNYFNDENVVKSTIELLNSCCNYYFQIFFLNEFISSLSVLGVQNQFYFMKPLDLMSYNKLQGGLEDLLAMLNFKKINNKKFENMAYKYMGLEFFDIEKYKYADERAKIPVAETRRRIGELRRKLTDAFKTENRKDIVKIIINLEYQFVNELELEAGW